MAVAPNRVFRVERANRNSNDKPSIVSCSSSEQERHQEIMSALAALREHADPQESFSQQVVETCQRDLQEAQKIKDELTQIHTAIAETKREIATLHDAGREDLKVSRMTDELGAIVKGTEQAIEEILSAAEEIDNKAANLIAALIPSLFDHDPCAQSRMPMDMIFQGRSTSLFHASQQCPTISS